MVELFSLPITLVALQETLLTSTRGRCCLMGSERESNELKLVWLELSKKAITFNKQRLERKRNTCQSLYIGSTVYWVGGFSLFIY